MEHRTARILGMTFISLVHNVAAMLLNSTTENVILQDWFRDVTGLPISTYFSAFKFVWLYENVPAVKNAVDNGTAMFGTVDSWIIYNLTGRTVHVTDGTSSLFFVCLLLWLRVALNKLIDQINIAVTCKRCHYKVHNILNRKTAIEILQPFAMIFISIVWLNSAKLYGCKPYYEVIRFFHLCPTHEKPGERSSTLNKNWWFMNAE